MNITIHLPGDETGQKKLKKQVAEIHADAVKEYIKKLNCPPEQKQNIAHIIIEKMKKAGNT